MNDPVPSRSVADPSPGYFRMRLVRKGPWVPARILHHSDGSWQAVVDGEIYPADANPAAATKVFTIWHGGHFISEAEYLALLREKGWARAHQPDHPAANPRKPIDLRRLPPIF